MNYRKESGSMKTRTLFSLLLTMNVRITTLQRLAASTLMNIDEAWQTDWEKVLEHGGYAVSTGKIQSLGIYRISCTLPNSLIANGSSCHLAQ